jgi:hypothetical protein
MKKNFMLKINSRINGTLNSWKELLRKYKSKLFEIDPDLNKMMQVVSKHHEKAEAIRLQSCIKKNLSVIGGVSKIILLLDYRVMYLKETVPGIYIENELKEINQKLIALNHSVNSILKDYTKFRAIFFFRYS